MLIDLRLYTFHPGALGTFLPMFESTGLALQRKHCGRLLVYATVHTGRLNTVAQAWAYRDASDRDERRARLWADPEWLAFGERALPLLRHQEVRLLRTTSFTDAAEPFEGAGLVDLRTYTFAPGALAKFLPLCERQGYPLQRQHCGHLVFHATSETGVLNQVVQAWAYRDLSDYEARQHALLGDATWQRDYRAHALALTVDQEHALLAPTRFSPVIGPPPEPAR